MQKNQKASLKNKHSMSISILLQNSMWDIGLRKISLSTFDYWLLLILQTLFSTAGPIMVKKNLAQQNSVPVQCLTNIQINVKKINVCNSLNCGYIDSDI